MSARSKPSAAQREADLFLAAFSGRPLSPRCTLEWLDDQGAPDVCHITAEEAFDVSRHKPDRIEEGWVVLRHVFLKETKPQNRDLRFAAGYAEALFELVTGKDCPRGTLRALGFRNVTGDNPDDCYLSAAEQAATRELVQQKDDGGIISIAYGDDPPVFLAFFIPRPPYEYQKTEHHDQPEVESVSIH